MSFAYITKFGIGFEFKKFVKVIIIMISYYNSHLV